MNKAKDHKFDTRQLEKMRCRYHDAPGKPRFLHLSGPSESYIPSVWHVGVGDLVKAPQVIATIESDSFIIDFEVFDSGILTERCFAVGEIIPHGAVVARVDLVREPSRNEARNP